MADGVAGGTLSGPVGLRCEYAVNPIGLDEHFPRFFWRLADDRQGASQTAYRIIVGTRPGESDIWDSGEVKSSQTTHLVFGQILGEGGKEPVKLKSRTRYFWQVRYRDHDGAASPWSDSAFFELGILKTSEWRAQWVSIPWTFEKETPGPAKYLRRAFVVRRPLKKARLYLTARGLVLPRLNGQRVGEDVFTPGWSDYRKRLRYLTYDVTNQLVMGRNALGAVLGDGWYTGHIAWQGRGVYGENTALLAELHIEYADGSYEVIRTDLEWKGTTDGPIRSSDMLMGEHYDAARETALAGWDTAGFIDDAWLPVRVEAHDKIPLEAYVGEPTRAVAMIEPREAWRTTDGKWIFDMGQNMVGWGRLKVRGQPGQEITLRFAEVLNPDRTIYITNLRKAKATDVYICKGGGTPEEWEPSFTYHGFRYVEVSGLLPGQTPGLDTVTGVVIHNDMPVAGKWGSNHEELNQLMHNIVWGHKGNYLEIPTDCPQRDERLGWTGDAQVFIKTASYNFEVAGFFSRWLTDLADAQRPDGAYCDVAPELPGSKLRSGIAAWADAGVVCPWTIYERYGDVRVLERHWETMRRFAGYLVKTWPNFLRHDGEWTYGDWLSIDSWTPRPLIGCAYSAYTFSLMAKIAAVLKKEKDTTKYSRLFEKAKKAFNKEFVTDGGYLAGDSQTAYLLAIRFGLLDEQKRALAIKHLTGDLQGRGVLTTGFVGVNLLLPTLSEIGRDDLAMLLLTSEKFPGWLYSVKHGATTIWERWDGWTAEKGFQNPGMNSFNHYAYGSCGEWMYGALLGLDVDAGSVGFSRVRVQPRIKEAVKKGITRCAGSVDTLHGKVEMSWKVEDGGWRVELRLPAGVQGKVVLPTGEPVETASGRHEYSGPLPPE